MTFKNVNRKQRMSKVVTGACARFRNVGFTLPSLFLGPGGARPPNAFWGILRLKNDTIRGTKKHTNFYYSLKKTLTAER